MHTILMSLILIFQGLLLNQANAGDNQLDLKTPRGAMIKIDIYNPGLNKALVLAPGQGCGPRLDMFDTIASEAKASGFTVVRLYWAYCLTTPNGNPAEDLSTEKEDLQTTLDYVQSDLGFAQSSISVGGKSLGTFVSFEIFKSQKNLKSLLFLTPVCTDSETDPANHKNVFSEYYPGLAEETRPILLVQGNVDPLCDTNHFQDYLRGKANNFNPIVVRGDHGFGVKNPDGKYNVDLGLKNLQTIAKWVFIWL